MQEKQPKTGQEMVQLVVFRLRNEEFGADISAILEIVRVGDITHIPEAPMFIKGVMNLRGQVIAVIDLARQFEFELEEVLPPKARVVIAQIGGQTLGLLVDEASKVVKIPAENIEPAPELIQSRVKRDYIKGVAKLEDSLIILLDLDKILAVEEMEAVNGYQSDPTDPSE